ncbi:hypothetical protein [Cupriavidus necator]|uniref:hypothetical protein n=1 Tax=Cupriavidus necator TaxID=106590 RepID=UPI0012D34E58|nr:hypothetical protein [Cupriavidus necator]
MALRNYGPTPVDGRLGLFPFLANHPRIPPSPLLSLPGNNNGDGKVAVALGDVTAQLGCWEGYSLRGCGRSVSAVHVKVIKRMAYSFRDAHYFVLKIRAAFPGNL